jgi:hypothetical protein
VDGGNSNKYGQNLCQIIACFSGPGLVILVCEQSSIDNFYPLAADGGGAYDPMGNQGFSVKLGGDPGAGRQASNASLKSITEWW